MSKQMVDSATHPRHQRRQNVSKNDGGPARLTSAQQRLLATIRDNPGLLWYETGEKAWPHKTVGRINLFGRPFRELTGHGADLTSRTLDRLKALGLIERRDDLRYYAMLREREVGHDD